MSGALNLVQFRSVLRFFLSLHLLLLGYSLLPAQTASESRYVLEIVPGSIEYDHNEHKVKLDLTALPDQTGGWNNEHFIIVDEQGVRRDTLQIHKVLRKAPDTTEQFTVLFLIDISGSMASERKGELAKRAVQSAMRYSNFPPQAQSFIATFDDIVSTQIPITRETVERSLERIEIDFVGDTDLFRAIIEEVNWLRQRPGKKALILLSDGKNDVLRNPRYKSAGGTEDPPDEGDVFKAIKTVDSSFLILPIALGTVNIDTTFLKQLPDSTVNDLDVYSFSETPQELEDIFVELTSSLAGNYTILLDPNYEYHGEQRTLKVTWVSNKYAPGFDIFNSDKQLYSIGTDLLPITTPCSTRDLLQQIIAGIILLFVIFAILSLMVPLVKRRQFRRKYVVPYKQTGHIVEYDTVTNEPLKDGQLVVVKCQKTVPLSVWEGLGYQCPHFPDCMSYLKCNGAGAKETHDSFFSQKGMLKKLNWMLFGGFGGLLAWAVFAIYYCDVINFTWHEDMVGRLLGIIPMLNLNPIQIGNIASQTFIGIGIGFGLTTALAIVEQVGQSRRFSITSVIIKVLLGSLFGGLIFFGGAILQSTIIPNPYLSGLIRWIIFGIFFGMTLSVMSSVSMMRGILGATLASVIAFHIYFLAFTDVLQQLEIIDYIRLVSFVLLGVILGYTIVTVVTRLEDFEFEFIAPEQYNGRVVPISKWLKQGMEIAIGKTPKCHIFISWDEHILEQHALLSYRDEQVFIEPVGETLVNGHMLSDKSLTPLRDGAIVQLGRNSITQIMYKEKRAKADEPQPVKPDPYQYKRQQYEHKDTRPKINIKPRNT